MNVCERGGYGGVCVWGGLTKQVGGEWESPFLPYRPLWFLPVAAMTGGTVTVVIQTVLSTVVVALVFWALVDTIIGTDVVVISVQQQKITSITHVTCVM